VQVVIILFCAAAPFAGCATGALDFAAPLAGGMVCAFTSNENETKREATAMIASALFILPSVWFGSEAFN
jgi:hypothetical protein